MIHYEMPSEIHQNQFEFVQYLAINDEYVVLIYNLSYQKYNLYLITTLQLETDGIENKGYVCLPLSASEIVERFPYVSLSFASSMFPSYGFYEGNYGYGRD